MNKTLNFLIICYDFLIATIYHSGTRLITLTCQCCNYQKQEKEIIPQVSESSSYGGGGSSSGGGGAGGDY